MFTSLALLQTFILISPDCPEELFSGALFDSFYLLACMADSRRGGGRLWACLKFSLPPPPSSATMQAINLLFCWPIIDLL